jgi:hypothetical protein
MIPGAFPKERRCRKGLSFFWDQFRRDLRALTRRLAGCFFGTVAIGGLCQPLLTIAHALPV